MAHRSPRGPAVVVLILAAIFGIAACRGAATGSGGPAATPLASLGDASPATTPVAAPTPTGAGRLEDLLPDEVGGIQLTKSTILGPDIGELEPEEAANFATVLENVDGTPEAFAVVTATGDGITIAAWRMEGTDARQLGEAFIGSILQASEGTQVEDVTIDGKEVKQVTPPNTVPLHVYVMGEVMFVVQAADTALVAEAFAALP